MLMKLTPVLTLAALKHLTVFFTQNRKGFAVNQMHMFIFLTGRCRYHQHFEEIQFSLY